MNIVALRRRWGGFKPPTLVIENYGTAPAAGSYIQVCWPSPPEGKGGSGKHAVVLCIAAGPEAAESNPRLCAVPYLHNNCVRRRLGRWAALERQLRRCVERDSRDVQLERADLKQLKGLIPFDGDGYIAAVEETDSSKFWTLCLKPQRRTKKIKYFVRHVEKRRTGTAASNRGHQRRHRPWDRGYVWCYRRTHAGLHSRLLSIHLELQSQEEEHFKSIIVRDSNSNDNKDEPIVGDVVYQVHPLRTVSNAILLFFILAFPLVPVLRDAWSSNPLFQLIVGLAGVGIVSALVLNALSFFRKVLDLPLPKLHVLATHFEWILNSLWLTIGGITASLFVAPFSPISLDRPTTVLLPVAKLQVTQTLRLVPRPRSPPLEATAMIQNQGTTAVTIAQIVIAARRFDTSPNKGTSESGDFPTYCRNGYLPCQNLTLQPQEAVLIHGYPDNYDRVGTVYYVYLTYQLNDHKWYDDLVFSCIKVQLANKESDPTRIQIIRCPKDPTNTVGP